MNLRIASLLACFVLALTSTRVHAQGYAIDRGSLVLEGSASLTSTGFDSDSEFESEEDERTTQLLVNPSLQYFVVPGLAVGGDVLLAYSVRDDVSSTSIGAGPAVSYFFGRSERPVYPFVSASLQLVRTSFDSDGSDESSTSFGYRASGGAVVMLVRNVGVSGELFYQSSSDSNDDVEISYNTFGLSVGVTAFIF